MKLKFQNNFKNTALYKSEWKMKLFNQTLFWKTTSNKFKSVLKNLTIQTNTRKQS